MKVSTQILSSIVGITVLTQIIFGSVAYFIILKDNADHHVGNLLQIAKIIQNNLSVSELKTNSQTHLEKLHNNFTTGETILLLNTNNKLFIAGKDSKYSSNIYESLTLAYKLNPLENRSGTINIDNASFHWHSSQLDDETELVFLESCVKYKSESILGVRLITISIIITWLGVWIALFLSHIISKSLKAKNKELQRQAFHDRLTGLPNRLLLLDILDQALLDSNKHDKNFALLLMDLDNFKDINDTLGHHYGDELLQQIGEKTKQCFRKHDTFARLGGDEFAAILPDTDLNSVKVCIEKLLSNMKNPHSIYETLIESKASIGVALYPFHGNDRETLLQHADIAMYQAKKMHTGYAIYDSSFDFYRNL